jgi:hypothetical protein
MNQDFVKRREQQQQQQQRTQQKIGNKNIPKKGEEISKSAVFQFLSNRKYEENICQKTVLYVHFVFFAAILFINVIQVIPLVIYNTKKRQF